MGRARAILARRRILTLLIVRDLKVKYSDSRLGYLWTVLDPLLMGAVFWFIFTVVFQRGKDIAGEPYIIYLLAALFPFQWTTSVIGRSARILGGEARLIRSVDVPRELWILRTVCSSFVEYLFTIPVLVVLLLGFWHPVGWGLLWLPLAMAMQGVTLIGIALIMAPVTVMYPDVERVIQVVNRLLLYFCPVLYGAFAVLENDNLPQVVKELYAANPFTTIIGFYRAGLFDDEVVDLDVALRGGVVILALLAVGVYVFRRLESAVLKEI